MYTLFRISIILSYNIKIFIVTKYHFLILKKVNCLTYACKSCIVIGVEQLVLLK